MELFMSEAIIRGAFSGRYNARGVVSRMEGGIQERELAGTFRQWAKALLYTHPFVATKLLRELEKTYKNEAEQEDLEAKIRRRQM
jgi:hypothetical protein